MPFSLSIYVVLQAIGWHPEISYIFSALPVVAMDGAKVLGASWSESLLAFSGASLAQSVFFGTVAVGKWALGYGR